MLIVLKMAIKTNHVSLAKALVKFNFCFDLQRTPGIFFTSEQQGVCSQVLWASKNPGGGGGGDFHIKITGLLWLKHMSYSVIFFGTMP